MKAKRAKRPRCYLVHALAPDGTTMRNANTAINALIGDRKLPLVVFHDHFLDQPGGIAVFDIANTDQLDALEAGVLEHIPDWRVEIRPFIFSHSPAAFDEQIAYTLRTYRDLDWEMLQREKRPNYGNPSNESATGIED